MFNEQNLFNKMLLKHIVEHIFYMLNRDVTITVLTINHDKIPHG